MQLTTTAPWWRSLGRAEFVVTASAVALALAVTGTTLGWRGIDFPAQIYRVELFRREGFTLWNGNWYGGHPTLSYSVLYPPLGAVLTPIGVGIGSTVAAVACFASLVRAHFGTRARLGAIWFGVAAAANLVTGRITFSLGLAFGLAALLALQRRREPWAIGLAVLCSLASPLAGAFLALAAVTYGLVTRRWWLAAGLTLASIGPVLLIAGLFPSGGRYPFGVGALVFDLVLFAVALWVLPPEQRALRVGVGLYALASVATFAVSTPVGGNVQRLAMLLLGPVLACTWRGRRAWLIGALAVPLLVWQLSPVAQAARSTQVDPSVHESYHEPLVRFVRGHDGPVRIEIPFTANHWESAYVAPYVPLARGWERQLDLAYNEVLYQDTLTPVEYRRWLDDNAVGYVALPDVSLDPSSEAEAALLRRGLSYLQEVWHDAHWTVWRVVDPTPLVEGSARLDFLDADSFVLDVQAPGDVLVRVRSSSHWAVIDGEGCVAATDEGWTMVHAAAPGRLEVGQVLAPAGSDHACPAGSG